MIGGHRIFALTVFTTTLIVSSLITTSASTGRPTFDYISNGDYKGRSGGHVATQVCITKGASLCSSTNLCVFTGMN